jgi:lactate permease
VDIAAALVAMAAIVILLRFWKPKSDEGPRHPAAKTDRPLRAWTPWIMLTLFVGFWTTPLAKTWFNGYAPGTKPVSTWQAPIIPVPPLHLTVQKMPPVVAKAEPEKAAFTFNYLSATGTALLLAGIAAGLLLGKGPASLAAIYLRCLWRVRISLLTIALMLALGYTTRFSGTDTTMGLLLAQTGWWFPFFSPLIGWLGVALTGSDTASNVLFGNLQSVSAQQIGLSPILTASANSSGGVMGKMIDAQSIVVASVATGGRDDSPDAGTVLRAVVWHSLALALLVGLLVMAQAYLFPGMISK